MSEHDGYMDIHLRTVNGQVTSAGPVPQPNGVRNQLYGKYVVRWKADHITGYKVAWLLWPQSNVWPRDGEIDFPEGNLDGGTIHAYMHRQNGTSGGDQDAFVTNVPVTGAWHTTVVEWTPNYVRFYLDGVLIGQSTSRIPNTPMRWVLQSETRLGGYSGPYGSGHILVDYVEVYSYTP